MGRFLFVFALIIVLSGGNMVLADEGHQEKHAPSTSNLNDNEHSGNDTNDSHDGMEGMDTNSDHDDMEGMDTNSDHDDMEGMDTSGDHDDMEGMDTSDNHDDMEDMETGDNHNDAESGGHGHGPVKETPPNVKVLGTFGAINLSFIVIGVWNKWLRRKDGSNGNSK